jgi:branched-chain amino acid transport system ATP-binding protein
MLRLEHVSARYGAIRALERVSLEVPQGQIVCLLGANGAGKTTTLNCISGIVPPETGHIFFDGEDIAGWRPDRIVAAGIVQVPEGREIFPDLNVADNLRLGTWTRRRSPDIARDLERVLEYFPVLRQRTRQAAGTLSGGEQQMLMIGRALMAQPKLLLLDEPSLGLSPVLIESLFAIIERVHDAGVPILLVEQNARMALAVSDYGYVLENGEIRVHGPAATLVDDSAVREAYLGA